MVSGNTIKLEKSLIDFYRRVLPDEPVDSFGSPVEGVTLLRIERLGAAGTVISSFSVFITHSDRRFFIEAPAEGVTPSSREFFVDMLEVAEQMGCTAVNVVVSANAPQLRSVLRSFSYLGFELVSPTAVRANLHRRIDDGFAVLGYDLI